jgi:hypothetical protein
MWALFAAVVVCALSGKGAALVAAATPVALNPTQFKIVPRATTQILALVPDFPMYGWVLALLVSIAAATTFKVSNDEDTRLQVTLFVSLIGYGVAMILWALVGVALVLIPHVANGA